MANRPDIDINETRVQFFRQAPQVTRPSRKMSTRLNLTLQQVRGMMCALCNSALFNSIFNSISDFISDFISDSIFDPISDCSA